MIFSEPIFRFRWKIVGVRQVEKAMENLVLAGGDDDAEKSKINDSKRAKRKLDFRVKTIVVMDICVSYGNRVTIRADPAD